MSEGRSPRPAGSESPTPMVAAVAMGYGHLRAAAAIADHLGVAVTRVDLPPLASPAEAALWRLARVLYEQLSRLAEGGGSRTLFGPALAGLTRIPDAGGDGHRHGTGSRVLGLLVRAGLGRRMSRRLVATGSPLLTTFYAPAMAAAHGGARRVLCLVTDSDIHPVWAAPETVADRVTYLAPSGSAAERLRRYGVPPERVVETGFPLPDELLGGPDLAVQRADLARRLVRLDPSGTFLGVARPEVEAELGPLPPTPRGPLHLVVAVGGAGAQTVRVRRLLSSLADAMARGLARVTLVAGDRGDVRRRFRRWLASVYPAPPPGAISILHRDSFLDAYRAFNRVLHDADVLWTKPSELSFYAALGLPLLLAPPVGDHERHNARWLVDNDAALPCPNAGELWPVLERELASGGLARRAFSGADRLPRRGLYRCARAIKVAEEEVLTPP